MRFICSFSFTHHPSCFSSFLFTVFLLLPFLHSIVLIFSLLPISFYCTAPRCYSSFFLFSSNPFTSFHPIQFIYTGPIHNKSHLKTLYSGRFKTLQNIFLSSLCPPYFPCFTFHLPSPPGNNLYLSFYLTSSFTSSFCFLLSFPVILPLFLPLMPGSFSPLLLFHFLHFFLPMLLFCISPFLSSLSLLIPSPVSHLLVILLSSFLQLSFPFRLCFLIPFLFHLSSLHPPLLFLLPSY